jgi:hypothetical protein
MTVKIIFLNGEVKRFENVTKTDIGNEIDTLYQIETRTRTIYVNLKQVRYVEEDETDG